MSTSQFPINPELTAVAVAYKNRDVALIADQVLPRVGGPKKFSWTKYDQASAYTVPNTKVGRKSEPTMVDFSGTLIPDEVADYGLDDLVPNDDIDAWEKMPKPASGGPVHPTFITAMLLTHLVQLDREIRVAATVFNSASYAAGNSTTLSGTSQWSDQTNSNPVAAIMGFLDIPIVRPNILVISGPGWTQLRTHPKVVQAVGNSAASAGVASRQMVADLFELDNILIGAGFVNTARKGQTPVMARVWGKHAAFLYTSELAAQIGQPTFGYTHQFGDKIAGSIPEPKKGLRGSVAVRVGESVKEVICAPDVGYFVQNCVA